MTIIKIMFSLLICFPLVVLGYRFLKKLVEQLYKK